METKFIKKSEKNNFVIQRQNQKRALELQAAARWLCNCSDGLAILSWFLTVIITCLGVIVQNNSIIILLQIIWFFVYFFLESKIVQFLEKATDYKQLFDNYVFGWTDSISQAQEIETNGILNSHRDWVNYQITHRGDEKPNGVMSWYSSNSEDDEFESIQRSMEENVAFDETSNKLILSIMIVLFLATLSVSMYLHLTVFQMLSTVFVTFTVISQKIIIDYLHVRKVNRLNENIKLLLSSAKSIQELKMIEEIFYAKRLIPGTSNFLLYMLKKKKLNFLYHKNT